MAEFRAKFVCTRSRNVKGSPFRSFVLTPIADPEAPDNERFTSQSSWQAGFRTRLEIASDNPELLKEIDERRVFIVTLTSAPVEP